MGRAKLEERTTTEEDGTKRRGNPDGLHDAFIAKEGYAKKTGKKKEPRKVRRLSSGGGVVRIKQAAVDIIEGRENLEEWTIDELVEGKKKGKGRPPNVIPIEVHQELARRVLNDARHMMVAELTYTVQKHFQIVKGIETERRKMPDGTFEDVAVDVTPVQLKAILAIEERVLGMPREQVDINIAVEKPYEKLLASAIVPNKEALEEYEKTQEQADEIVEGVLVDEAEGEDND